MVTPYDAFTRGAIMARNLAKRCLDEAETVTTGRAFQLIAEHDRCIDRAEWYEERAAWYAPKIEQEIAA